jgi:hypothetical protein
MPGFIHLSGFKVGTFLDKFRDALWFSWIALQMLSFVPLYLYIQKVEWFGGGGTLRQYGIPPSFFLGCEAVMLLYYGLRALKRGCTRVICAGFSLAVLWLISIAPVVLKAFLIQPFREDADYDWVTVSIPSGVVTTLILCVYIPMLIMRAWNRHKAYHAYVDEMNKLRDRKLGEDLDRLAAQGGRDMDVEIADWHKDPAFDKGKKFQLTAQKKGAADLSIGWRFFGWFGCKRVASDKVRVLELGDFSSDEEEPEPKIARLEDMDTQSLIDKLGVKLRMPKFRTEGNRKRHDPTWRREKGTERFIRARLLNKLAAQVRKAEVVNKKQAALEEVEAELIAEAEAQAMDRRQEHDNNKKNKKKDAPKSSGKRKPKDQKVEDDLEVTDL